MLQGGKTETGFFFLAILISIIFPFILIPNDLVLRFLAFIIFLIGGITDYLDGKIAQ